MNIIALIPARGGSKGVPQKNIKNISGNPLISFSIISGLESVHINEMYVSSENRKIQEISKKFGAKIIKRPSNLAKDDSKTIDVVLHTINSLEKKKIDIDILVLLQPTSPLRTSIDIDNAIDTFINNDCESVISVSELEHSPYWSLKLKNNFLTPNFGEKYFKMRRQELPKLYSPNGAIFISTPEYLRTNKTFYSKKALPYIMPSERSIDIDTELDFKMAEMILKEQKENESNSNSK
jgi:N-acylneuraminate cytidylyltransferase